MAWIKSYQEIERHPKTLVLMKEMNWSLDMTISKLHRLWWWCADYAYDGDISKHDPDTICTAIGMTDYKGEHLINCLVKAGFVDREPNLRLHDWWAHFGDYLRGKFARTPEKWKAVEACYTNACQTLGERSPLDKGKEIKKEETTLSCPYQGIVDLYHSILPELPRVKELTAARKGYLKSRWNENKERQSLEWWESFFKIYVLPSDFLKGRVPGRDGNKPFRADLEWLIKPSNFAKVYEGRYLPINTLKSNPKPIIEPSNAYKPFDITDPKGWEKLK